MTLKNPSKIVNELDQIYQPNKDRKKCSNCGTYLMRDRTKKHTNLCQRCYAWIHKAKKENIRKCPYCHAVNHKRKVFCVRCGRRFIETYG